MAQIAVFYQACPVCGRSLRISVQCFGRSVTCVHCGGEFRADAARQRPLPLDGNVLGTGESVDGTSVGPLPSADR